MLAAAKDAVQISNLVTAALVHVEEIAFQDYRWDEETAAATASGGMLSD